jgi:hypothetical protein
MLFLVILALLPLPAQRRIVSVPFHSVNTYMLVEASVDGRPVTLLVDTGVSPQNGDYSGTSLVVSEGLTVYSTHAYNSTWNLAEYSEV